MTNEHKPQDHINAGLLKRLGALFYDGLLIIAVLFVITGIGVALRRNEALSGPLYQGVLVVVVWYFYHWFWTHGGQTLGMQAWKIRLITNDEKPLGIIRSLIRFVVAWVTLGLGNLPLLFGKRHGALQDRLSSTRVVEVAKVKPATSTDE